MCPPELLRLANVFVLALFRASEQQMHLNPFLSEIRSVAGAEIQPQLGDSFTNRFDVAKEPFFEAIDSNSYSGPRPEIEAIQSFNERLSSCFILANENLTRDCFQIFLRAIFNVIFKSHIECSIALPIFQDKDQDASG
jgi:hypothetical protein